jgi:CBS domain-containing protein
MKSAVQLIEAKGAEVWSVAPESSVIEALRLMAEKGIGAVMVTEHDRLVGVFSERDYARKVILAGRSSSDTRVEEIMTREVVCAGPAHTVQECMALMTDKRIRHLPVLDGDRLLGMISIGDLVKETIAEQQFIIEQLERYISS